MASTEKRRLVELDFLRGIAILMVIGCHSAMPAEDAGRLYSLVWIGNRWGWTGVDLFFVLSGFLVGGLLFQEIRMHGRLDVVRFIIRRGFKIWPMYYTFLCVGFLVVMIKNHYSPAHTGHLFLPYLVHLQNYDLNGLAAHPLEEMTMNTVNHAWSLAVEEHFYLVLPFLALWLLRPTQRESRLHWIPGITLFVLIACLSARCGNLGLPYRNDRQLFPTHLRIDSLFCGVLLAYLYHLKPEIWQRWTRYPWLLLAVAPAIFIPLSRIKPDQPLIWTIGLSLIAFGYACLLSAVLSLAGRPGRCAAFFRSLPVRAVATVGYFSYGVYLWHRLVGRTLGMWIFNRGWLGAHGELRWLLVNGAYLGSSVVAATLICKLVEFPALALRERLFPPRSAAMGLQPALDAAHLSGAAAPGAEAVVNLQPAPGDADRAQTAEI
jgi:peptidoglycan/LPS O-acetylase OafA/YrhL